ncbi:hypothetical protein Ana3638_23620 [Anaerocolumna sedimenticola]|uniref:Uncharacterized protein n=1 Tax=Anaerocolumna sedimenticola TaxID=2696063 RepID=A0A6P1TSE1_9FIRM|nr:hypothetical protein [Anaerocolumna sedimenticola]QHQ63393.1 hypothetical protein Ana3638_23620 [Anaerocolumna sedimenticola]
MLRLSNGRKCIKNIRIRNDTLIENRDATLSIRIELYKVIEFIDTR